MTKKKDVENNSDIKSDIENVEEKFESQADDVELSEIEQLEQEMIKIAELNTNLLAEIETHKDSYLRKHADFENFRKRMQKEKQDQLKYANQDLLAAILEVVDNFERALVAAETAEDLTSFKDGIDIVAKQLTQVLEEKGHIEVVAGVGCEYDPNVHEALTQVEKDGVETATVEQEFQRGYKLYDRVIRTAKVSVAIPPSKKENE